jgi:UrcA family protein
MNIETLHSRRSGISQIAFGSLFLSPFLAIAPLAVKADPQSKSAPETVSKTVSFSDLDLTMPAGINAAHARLVAVARRLCHTFSNSLRASDRETSDACYRETLADATRRFNALLGTARADGTDVARNTP